MNEYAGAVAVNSIVLIDAEFEMVTDVGALLFVNVAVLSGTVLGGTEVQLVPTVHSAPGPVQVPSTACAVFGVKMASAPSQALPSNATRVAAERAADAAASIAQPDTAAPWPSARALRHHDRCEGMPEVPRATRVLRWRAIPYRHANGAASEGTGGVGPDQFRALAGSADYRNVWLSRHGQGMRHGAQAILYHVYRTVPVPA